MLQNRFSIAPGGYAVLELDALHFTTVDLTDLPEILAHKWYYASPRGRATKAYATGRIKGKTIHLHRFLMKPSDGLEVDHDDGDGLNNRRYNLIITTHSKNLHNRSKANKSSNTGVRGVSLQQTVQGPRYRAAITRDGAKTTRVFSATPEGLQQAREFLVPFQLRDGVSPPHAKRDKLGADARKAIHAAREAGAKTIDLAKRYDVSRITISRLLNGHSWKP